MGVGEGERERRPGHCWSPEETVESGGWSGTPSSVVMNVQEIPEMLCWCAWFAVLGTLLLSEQLCKDRFQFVSV